MSPFSVTCAVTMAVCTMAGHSPDPLPSRQMRDGCGGPAGSEGVTWDTYRREKTYIFPGKMDGSSPVPNIKDPMNGPKNA